MADGTFSGNVSGGPVLFSGYVQIGMNPAPVQEGMQTAERAVEKSASNIQRRVQHFDAMMDRSLKRLPDHMRGTAAAAGDASGNLGKFGRVFLEASRGAEDFAVQLGPMGLSGALRASGNNISQMMALVSPMAGAFAGVGIAILTGFIGPITRAIGVTHDYRTEIEKTIEALIRFREARQGAEERRQAERAAEREAAGAKPADLQRALLEAREDRAAAVDDADRMERRLKRELNEAVRKQIAAGVGDEFLAPLRQHMLEQLPPEEQLVTDPERRFTTSMILKKIEAGDFTLPLLEKALKAAGNFDPLLEELDKLRADMAETAKAIEILDNRMGILRKGLPAALEQEVENRNKERLKQEVEAMENEERGRKEVEQEQNRRREAQERLAGRREKLQGRLRMEQAFDEDPRLTKALKIEDELRRNLKDVGELFAEGGISRHGAAAMAGGFRGAAREQLLAAAREPRAARAEMVGISELSKKIQLGLMPDRTQRSAEDTAKNTAEIIKKADKLIDAVKNIEGFAVVAP